MLARLLILLLPLLLIVAIGIGLGVFGWSSTDEKYNARAVVVLVPPAVPGQPNEGNPLSNAPCGSP